jgi:GT2 family glycosyltransferase
MSSPPPAPEFSIIVCSHRPARAMAIRAHYAALFGARAHEIIVIDDARSLCEGYARGLAASGGRFVVFSHDDVEFVTADAPARIAAHLAAYDLIGIAGTTRLIDGVWMDAGDPHVFALVIYPQPDGYCSLRYAGQGPPVVGGIQALDGCFFACRREVAESVGFDAATFDGFHFYDLDFTFRAYLGGYRLAVCRDLALIHASTGTPDAAWQKYHDRFVAKYRGRFAEGEAGKVRTGHALAPKAALAQLTQAGQLLQSLRWG